MRVVLASDGLWDLFTPKEAVDLVLSVAPTAEACAERLVRWGRERAAPAERAALCRICSLSMQPTVTVAPNPCPPHTVRHARVRVRVRVSASDGTARLPSAFTRHHATALCARRAAACLLTRVRVVCACLRVCRAGQVAKAIERSNRKFNQLKDDITVLAQGSSSHAVLSSHSPLPCTAVSL